MGAFDEAEEILLSLIIKFEEQQLEAKDQENLSTKQVTNFLKNLFSIYDRSW